MSGARGEETERIRGIWDQTAPSYDGGTAVFERLLLEGGREWVCGQADGEVLEIGVGTGRNLEHYPAGVRLTGIDLSPAMLGIARERAARLGLNADLEEGDAERLHFADGRFDSVVCALVLCSIPDAPRAVAEARRVLRPGGTMLLLEHVRSPVALVRAIQMILDPIAVRLVGDHLVREPLEYLDVERFAIERFERRKLGIVERIRARRI